MEGSLMRWGLIASSEIEVYALISPLLKVIIEIMEHHWGMF